MKPFSIQDLEKYIEPDVFDLGLELIGNGTLTEIKELETNLWIARVNEAIEAEIQVSRNRIKSYSCDCEVAQNGDLCDHLAASMILLRRVKATPIKKAKSTKAKPKKITTANILNMASEAELKDFVRKYARSNRQFSVSLKTKFAHLFETEDLETKYNQVLETIIKAQVGRSSYLKTVRLRRLLKNLDELLNQAEDALAKQYFADVFALLAAFIDHIVPVIWKSNGEDIVERLDRAFSLVNQLVDKDLSTELETKIKERFITECPKFKYRSGETTARFFYALAVLHKKAGTLDVLSEFVEIQVKDTTWGKWLAAKWQVLRYRLAIALENEELKQVILTESLKSRFLFDRMLSDAEQRNDKETLKLLIESAKENDEGFFSKITIHTEKILLTIAREEKNKREITKYAKKLFLDTLDMQYFELLKQNSSKRRWKTTFEALIRTMTTNNKLWVHKEAVAELLIKEKKMSQLFSYISKSKSLALLSKYKTQLLASDKEQYLKLFEYLIMDFAKHYLGGNSAKHIVDAIQGLKNHKIDTFISHMKKELKESFPERQSLMNQLETI